MGAHLRAFVPVLLAASLIGCGAAATGGGAATESTQAVAAEHVAPAVVAVREAVEAVVPVPPPAPPAIDAQSVALIVRYEITSPTYYAAHLQAPVWPGAQSGVTWGIGYDGGQQTRARIAADWHAHADVGRLEQVSGIVGPSARALLPSLRDVVVSFPFAQQVFATSTLPAYVDLTAHAYRDGWSALRPSAQGALVATVYNRGAGMAGDRRREMRALRDECVPRQDYACMAAQFRSMTRLWTGTPIEAGMRSRYEATARLAELSPST